MRGSRWLAALLLVVTLPLGGCGLTERGVSPGAVVIEAATAPATWAPLAGAALLGVTGWDRDIADWAVRKAPVFGKREKAWTYSDDLQYALMAGMVASNLVPPGEDRAGGYADRRLAANALAFAGANAATAGLKEATRRERPDGSDRLSFPSGHATAAFTSAYQIQRNLNPEIGQPLARGLITATTTGLAAATGWARIEGEKHYPADVLAAAALSHVVTALSFGLLADPAAPRFSLDATPDSVMLGFSMALP
ncbi:MAG: phosphatase PAP2 family protein [Alphaproteobacteria bacterium]